MKKSLAMALLALVVIPGGSRTQAAKDEDQTGRETPEAPYGVTTDRHHGGPAALSGSQHSNVNRRARQPVTTDGQRAPKESERLSLERMVATASGAPRATADPLLSGDLSSRWEQDHLDLDLLEERNSGWDASSSGRYRPYHSSGTSRRTAARSTKDASGGEASRPAAEPTGEGPVSAAGRAVANVSPWLRYAIISAPAALGLLVLAVYLLVRWRYGDGRQRRARRTALLVGLVEPDEQRRVDTPARRGAADREPQPAAEKTTPRRRAA
ncbi:MAG: hypothetical protein ACOC46_03770 [Pirellulales bacterium]